MGEPLESSRGSKAVPRIPWVPLILLVGTVFLFWVYPYQCDKGGVKVEFSDSPK